MIFLSVLGVAFAVGASVAVIGALFRFWFNLSDGAWWGFAALLTSVGVVGGAVAQIVQWCLA